MAHRGDLIQQSMQLPFCANCRATEWRILKTTTQMVKHVLNKEIMEMATELSSGAFLLILKMF